MLGLIIYGTIVKNKLGLNFRRVLCPNCRTEMPPGPDEDGVICRFRFLDDAMAARDEGAHWFKVPEILGMQDGPAMLSSLMKRGLQGEALKAAYATLDRLHRVVHAHNLINYYEEETQDVERVLNIFIRLNQGGTVLSYSDLLLSIAVAQWKQLDARAEIHTRRAESDRDWIRPQPRLCA